jgi:hypothetical protein
MAQQYKRILISSGGGGGGGDAINIDYDNASSGMSANNVQSAIDELKSLEYRPRPLYTVTGADVTAGSIGLVITPVNPTLTRLTVGGIRHEYGTDFIVSGSTLSWSGLGLDGIVEAGDILQLEIK